MNELFDNTRKLTTYAQGKIFFEANAWESAYNEFYRLYSEARDYEDVAELCADAAFRNAVRGDIPASWEHQVEWLEKVIDIDPSHRKGRTQAQLDEARHHWAKELLDRNDKQAAILQLEKISERYQHWGAAQTTRAEAYRALGQQEYGDRHWQGAISWWKKALVISQSQESALRGPIREARVRAWIDEHGLQLALVGVLLIFLATCFVMWPRALGVIGLPMVAPTPTTPALTLTLAPTATVTSVPNETQGPASPTVTATPSSTLTPSLMPTHTSTPISTVTPTSLPNRAPTSTSVARPSSTPTPKEKKIPPPTPTEKPEPPVGKCPPNC